MQITIHFASGFQVEGVVLSVAGDMMRVAIRDWDDAAEFNRSCGDWHSENGDVVQIDGPELLTTVPLPFLDSGADRVQPRTWVN